MQQKVLQMALLLKYVKNAVPIIFLLVKSRSFAKQSYMKKFSLIAIFLPAVLLLQNCKKDTQTAIATSTRQLIATINDTTWDPTPSLISSTITYNSATGSKTFAFTGSDTIRKVDVSVTQLPASNTPGFPLSTYAANGTNNLFAYSYRVKDDAGDYVFTPLGTVSAGSGSVTVTAIDSVAKTITGTFYFTSKQINYDTDGVTIKSVTVYNVGSGGFNKLPYTFVSN